MSRRQSVSAAVAGVLLLWLGLAAFRCLVARADMRHRLRLYQLLESERPNDRRLAVLLLAAPRHGGTADLTVAVHTLSADPSASVRTTAASAIAQGITGERYRSVDEADALYSRLLVAMTSDSSSDVRAWASFQALSVLEETLTSRPELSRRLAAIGALRFEAALHDEDSQVRENAEKAVQYIRDESQAPGAWTPAQDPGSHSGRD